MMFRECVLACIATLISTAAHAAFLSIDPSRFAAGTDISNAYEGISLSNISGGYPPSTPLTTSAVFATQCVGCADEMSGKIVFGHDPLAFDVAPYVFDYADFAARYYEEDYSSTYHFVAGRWNALRIDFLQPTSSIQVIGGGARNGNFFMFDVWDASGRRIARCSSALLDPQCGATALNTVEPDPSKSIWSFTFNSSSPSISFITAGGWGGGQYVHSVGFEVPEPSTFTLFALGLLVVLTGARAHQRRRPTSKLGSMTAKVGRTRRYRHDLARRDHVHSIGI